MKKFLAFSLLVFLLAQSGGLISLYSLQQQFVQDFMLEELNNPNAEFETIQLSKADFEKGRKNSFEVKFEGKMYDVKNIEFFGDSVRMLALHDVKEETILHEIEKMICHAEDQNGTLPVLILKLSTLLYLPAIFADGNFIAKIEKQQNLFFNEDVLCTSFKEITSPPPEKG